ncbi:MFS transporter [Actinomadura sp. 6N118]|uniref:MFS transporter n=1 Tax=Actinomadura sp. 6N118 TaxID=3375151 RepID=UPI00379220A9
MSRKAVGGKGVRGKGVDGKGAGLRSGRRNLSGAAAVGALAVAAFCYGSTETLPIGLLQLVAADLQTSQTAVGMLVTGYGLMVAVVSVPLTLVVGRVDRRRLMLVVLAVFVAATAVTAVANSYWVLLAARITTALAHAVFWPVAVVVAAGLLAPEIRGRAAAFVFTGGSLAVVLGVPAGTWLGQQVGWRWSFAVLSVLGTLALAATAALLPATPPGESHADTATAPDRRRYLLLVAVTVLTVAGTFTFFTYITAFLTEVSGVPEHAISVLLLVNGVADIIGLACAGALVDRGPRAMLGVAAALLTAALAMLYVAGTTPVMAAGALVLLGLGLPALATAMQARVLETAPGSTDVASAGTSAGFNLGIGGGALLGGLLLPVAGARSTALAGAVLTAAALAIVLGEPAIAKRSGLKELPARWPGCSG